MFLKEASADADVKDARRPKFVKALVVRTHRDKDEIPALQQHPFAIDLLVIAPG